LVEGKTFLIKFEFDESIKNNKQQIVTQKKNKKEKNLPDGEKLVVFPPVCVGRRCCVIDIGFDDSFAD
jgi:hypothetical protein